MAKSFMGRLLGIGANNKPASVSVSEHEPTNRVAHLPLESRDWVNRWGEDMLALGTRAMTRRNTPPEVIESLYLRLPFSSPTSDLEKALFEWALDETDMETFCKLGESRQEVDSSPMASMFFFPRLVVRTTEAFYLVETRTQPWHMPARLEAAVNWCTRINALSPRQRGGLSWGYVLIGNSLFHDWRQRGGSMGELLKVARIQSSASLTTRPQRER